MVIVVIAVLLVVILVLIVYNIHIQKKIEQFNNMQQRIDSLKALQNFMDITGEEISVDEKLRQINEVIIEKFEIKYSTIVVFDGAEYIIKASNVEKKHHETLRNLHSEEIFKESVTTAVPKYITIENENERLPYQKTEMGRAKSAMFFPLYIDNVYIGYWIMESGQIDAFAHLDTTILETVKENIISSLKAISYQDTIENTDRIDQFTSLRSPQYLYGEAKKEIDKYDTSAVTMFRITNIEEINEEMSRQIGNEIISEVSNIIKEKISDEYIFIRYMGPKFVIVFSGVEENSVEEFLKTVKEEIEELEIIDEEIEEMDEEDQVIISPKVNFVITTYYKGTGIEKVTNKLEEYLDEAPKSENQINYI